MKGIRKLAALRPSPRAGQPEALESPPRHSLLAHNPWTAFLLRRLLSLTLILAGLVVVTFLMIPLIPGSAAVAILGVEATTQDIVRLERELGLDQPLSTQFTAYAGRLAQGDLGRSFRTTQPVTEVIASTLPHSAALAGWSLLCVMTLSVLLGMLAGAYTQHGRHPRFEMVFMAVSSVAGSLPQFLTATFLAFIFAVSLRLLPVAGTVGWQTLVLPVAAIATAPVFMLARIVRLETLNVLAQDYVRTAKSKRLPSRTIYVRHVLPNVLTGALTVGGILFSSIVGGAVLVENVYGRLGMGSTLVAAVVQKDYPVIQGIVLVLGCVVVGVNAIVDICLALVDPRSLARQS